MKGATKLTIGGLIAGLLSTINLIPVEALDAKGVANGLANQISFTNGLLSDSAAKEKWFPVLAESPGYKSEAAPEVTLVGRIGGSGGHPVGHPEQMQWFYSVRIDHPWIPVENLHQHQKAFLDLCASAPSSMTNQAKVLVRAKIVAAPRLMGRPLALIGSIRSVGEDDLDWQSPWPLNIVLLPDPRQVSIESIIACQATGPAITALEYSGVYHSRQPFKVLEVFHGGGEAGQILDLRYSFVSNIGGEITNGQKVIWMLYTNDYSTNAYGAVSDTPNNRIAVKDLAKRILKSGSRENTARSNQQSAPQQVAPDESQHND